MKKSQDENKERRLYKIGYLTRRLGITPRTVRYYDQLGLLPHVKRSDGNVRLFDDEDIEIIKKIRRMQKEQYMPLDIIRDKIFGTDTTLESHVAIVTDSTAVIPEKMRAQHDIRVVPLSIFIKGKEFKDDGSINHKDFWRKNTKAQEKAYTKPPTVEDFVATYMELAEKGVKRIYSIHLASSMSETYVNADTAAQQVAHKVEVVAIDSKSVGAGLGLFAIQLAQEVQNGASIQELDLFVTKQVPLIYMTTVLNDIYYLSTRKTLKFTDVEGKEPELMKQLYQFKPIFTLKSEAGAEGEIDVIDCVKTQEEAKTKLLAHIENEFLARGRYAKHIMIAYNYLYGEAMELANDIKSFCPNTPIIVEEGCLPLSVYLGQEMISVSIA